MITDQRRGDLDPRVNAFRSDIADARLKGVVAARSFVDGQHALVATASAVVRGRPDHTAPMTTEFLFGEPVTVFEDRDDGWVWAQSGIDGYVGYLAADSLGPAVLGAADPTPVTALRAPVFMKADIKSPVVAMLSMGSLPILEPEKGGFHFINALDGYIHCRHVARRSSSDIAETAMMFLHTPYVWGGRSSIGIDCSGLVQRALLQAGMSAPRDSDQLARSVGDAVMVTSVATDGAFRRGDIVAFPGHIGIMIDGERLVHANAAAMAVSIDPVDAVADRILPTDDVRSAESGDHRPGIIAVRRIADHRAPGQ